MTTPPENETLSAFERPSRAAFVVRTFAFVATRMPAQPAAPEHRAPMKNDSETKAIVPAEKMPSVIAEMLSGAVDV